MCVCVLLCVYVSDAIVTNITAVIHTVVGKCYDCNPIPKKGSNTEKMTIMQEITEDVLFIHKYNYIMFRGILVGIFLLSTFEVIAHF